VFSVVAFIYGKTAMGWLAVWFCILFSVLFAFRQVHGRGKKGLMTGKGLFRVDRRYLLFWVQVFSYSTVLYCRLTKEGGVQVKTGGSNWTDPTPNHAARTVCTAHTYRTVHSKYRTYIPYIHTVPYDGTVHTCLCKPLNTTVHFKNTRSNTSSL
jgi:hypothetical protein